MSGGGFFVTARKVFDHPLFAGEPYSRGHAWLWMVAEAAWQDGPAFSRGQLAISHRGMARQFAWTDKKVRWFLASLEAEKMIEIKGALKGAKRGACAAIITICNYNKYQNSKNAKGALKGALKGAVEKEEKEQNKSKKENIRRVEADHDQFDEFWKAYPKREGSNPKHPASVKFAAAVKYGTAASKIVAGARRYAAQVRHLKTEPRFIAQAVTWLNQHRWNDDGQQADPIMTNEERQALLDSMRVRT